MNFDQTCTLILIWVQNVCNIPYLRTQADKRSRQVRGVATYTQKRKCVHIWIKNMGRFYHNSDGFMVVCV